MMGQDFIKAKRSIKRTSHRLEDERRNLQNQSAKEGAPPLHFDKSKAPWLSITVKLFPPQFSWGAFTPAGRPEVPFSPTTQILFASVSTLICKPELNRDSTPVIIRRTFFGRTGIGPLRARQRGGTKYDGVLIAKLGERLLSQAFTARIKS